jgi:hypothetical protein
MKITLTGLCAAGLVMGVPLAAAAISLTDYKFPESTSQIGTLDATFSSQNANNDDQIGYNLGATGRYDFFHRSLPFSWEFHVLGVGNAERGTQNVPDTTATDSINTPDSRGGYDLAASTTADKYLHDTSDIFTYGRTLVGYRAAVGHRPDEPYWDVAGGMGYGRIIDATVLKQALRMNDDFKQYGVIKRDIPDDAILELAGIIDRESEYQNRYGSIEYKKYWYEDMEEVVRRSGVLTGSGLGAMGIIRIEDILAELTGRRSYGWLARAGLGVVISDFAPGNQGEGDVFGEARLDWSRPAGLDLQFNDEASIQTTFVNHPVYTLTNDFQLYYEISNRIDWDNRLGTRYDVYTQDGRPDVFHLVASTSYQLYIANRLQFTPQFTYTYTDDGTGAQNPWNWNLSANVRYRLR